MGVIPVSSDHPGYLADKYLGTKFDIVIGVYNSLGWLNELSQSADVAEENIGEIRTMYSDINEMFGGIEEIHQAAEDVTNKQAQIDASIFDMAFNLIRTQAIVAKYHAFA